MVPNFYNKTLDLSKLLEQDVDELIDVVHEFQLNEVRHPLFDKAMAIEILINTRDFNYHNGNDFLMEYFKKYIVPVIQYASCYPVIIRPSKYLSANQASVCIGYGLAAEGKLAVDYGGQTIAFINDATIQITDQLMSHHGIYFKYPFCLNIDKYGKITYSPESDPQVISDFSVVSLTQQPVSNCRK